MPYCSRCGSIIKPVHKFCSKCGTPIYSYVSSRNSKSNIPLQDNISLSCQLTKLANNVDSLVSVTNQIENLKMKTSIPEPKKPVIVSRWWAMKVYIFGGSGALVAAISVLIFFVSISESLDSVGMVVFGILYFSLLAVGGTLNIIGVSISKKRMENYNSISIAKYNAEVQRRNAMLINYRQQYSGLENKKNIILKQIQDCLMNNGNRIVIPRNYFYSDAIRFFADRIATGRANSLSEAICAYNMRDPTTTTISDTTSLSKTNTYKKLIEEITSDSSLKTIYIFKRKTSTRLCLFCDGENSVEAKNCVICGQDLN